MDMKTLFFSALTLMFVGIVGAGCHSQATPKVNYYYVDSDQQKSAKSGKTFEDPSKIMPSSAATTDLKKLISDQKTAHSELMANPSSKRLQQKFIKASDILALGYQMSPTVSRKIKYRKALSLYRQMLKIDPHDYDATHDSKLIISIYIELNIPVPQN